MNGDNLINSPSCENAGKINFYLFAREPSDPEVTVLAEVRHGPIVFGQDPPRNTKEMLDMFERDLVAGTVSARLKNIKNKFKSIDFKGAACLSFSQVGEDHAAVSGGKTQVMVLTFDGVACIHPQKPERYIRMVLSQRAPAKKIEDLSGDLKKFTDSLEFM